MEPRTNADYLITDSIHIGKTEFVIGENQTRFGTMYVTWECKNGDNYFWGHYIQYPVCQQSTFHDFSLESSLSRNTDSVLMREIPLPLKVVYPLLFGPVYARSME